MSDNSRQERRQLQKAALKAEQRTDNTYKHAHRLIAKTAKEMAAEWYEESAHSNAFYTHYPDLDLFVAAEWHNFVPKAREILASMLARQDLPLNMKDEIHEALIADRQLPRPDNVYRLQ